MSRGTAPGGTRSPSAACSSAVKATAADSRRAGPLVGAPVAAGGRLAAALDGFDAARRPRCRALARLSVASGRFGAHLGGGWRQSVRNSLMRRTPASAVLRGSQAAMGWTPPEPAAPVR